MLLPFSQFQPTSLNVEGFDDNVTNIQELNQLAEQMTTAMTNPNMGVSTVSMSDSGTITVQMPTTATVLSTSFKYGSVTNSGGRVIFYNVTDTSATDTITTDVGIYTIIITVSDSGSQNDTFTVPSDIYVSTDFITDITNVTATLDYGSGITSTKFDNTTKGVLYKLTLTTFMDLYNKTVIDTLIYNGIKRDITVHFVPKWGDFPITKAVSGTTTWVNGLVSLKAGFPVSIGNSTGVTLSLNVPASQVTVTNGTLTVINPNTINVKVTAQNVVCTVDLGNGLSAFLGA